MLLLCLGRVFLLFACKWSVVLSNAFYIACVFFVVTGRMSEERFTCEHDCGFGGTFATVERHELSGECLRRNAAMASAETKQGILWIIPISCVTPSVLFVDGISPSAAAAAAAGAVEGKAGASCTAAPPAPPPATSFWMPAQATASTFQL
jgi:hypothetical protein